MATGTARLMLLFPRSLIVNNEWVFCRGGLESGGEVESVGESGEWVGGAADYRLF